MESSAEPLHPAIAAIAARAQVHRVTAHHKTLVWRAFPADVAAGEAAKPALVLLHGGHGNWLHWLRNIDALRQTHNLWLADMPGFGDSDDVIELGDFGELVDALEDSLTQLIAPTTPIDLAGFSFGALAATHLAAQVSAQASPALKLCKLALLGPAGHGGPRRMESEMVNWRRARSEEQLREMHAHNLGVLMLHHPTNIDALALEIHREACLATRFYSKAFSRAATLVEQLDAVTLPTLLLWGEHDTTGEPENLAAQLCAGHPHRSSHIVRDAGHWVQFEAANEVNRALGEWFAKAV